MTITRDHYSAASHPFDAATTAFSLDTSTTNASITLTEGVYEITNASSAELYVRLGATTASVMPPTSGATTGGNSSCGTPRAVRPNYRYPGMIPGYAVFNFSSTYKFSDQLSATLLINNVFDRDYYTAGRLGINPFSPSINGAIGPGGFNYNSNDWLASTFLAPGAPRGAWLNMRYDF